MLITIPLPWRDFAWVGPKNTIWYIKNEKETFFGNRTKSVCIYGKKDPVHVFYNICKDVNTFEFVTQDYGRIGTVIFLHHAHIDEEDNVTNFGTLKFSERGKTSSLFDQLEARSTIETNNKVPFTEVALTTQTSMIDKPTHLYKLNRNYQVTLGDISIKIELNYVAEKQDGIHSRVDIKHHLEIRKGNKVIVPKVNISSFYHQSDLNACPIIEAARVKPNEIVAIVKWSHHDLMAFRIIDTWYIERLLWLGHEKTTDCPFHHLPKEIVREIIFFYREAFMGKKASIRENLSKEVSSVNSLYQGSLDYCFL